MCIWTTAMKFINVTILSLYLYDRKFHPNSMLMNEVMPLQKYTIGCMYKIFLHVWWHMALYYHSCQSSGSGGITKSGPTWAPVLASIIVLVEKENSSRTVTFSYCSNISVTITLASGCIQAVQYHNIMMLTFSLISSPCKVNG